MLFTGTAVVEFNDILFKASRRTFEFVEADFNEKICLTDGKPEEVSAWKEEKTRGSWRFKVTQ